jgi:MtN3 and saliva related transmembrane protein
VIVWLGLLSGALTTGAWLPQLARTWRTKHADDISYAYLLTFCAGIFGWMVYGIAQGEVAIIVANALTLALALSQLWLKVRSKHGSDLAPTLPA